MLEIENFNLSYADIVSSLSLVIPILSLIVSIYAAHISRKNNKEILAFNFYKDNEEKLKPYRKVTVENYFKVKNIFSEFSRSFCETQEKICHYIDEFDNGNNTRIIKLGHHLNKICEIFIEENKNDILFQPIEHMQRRIVNTNTSYLDLLGKDFNENSIKFNLKILYDNFDLSKKDEFYKFAKNYLKNVCKVYEKNQELIDKTIHTLELEKINYKNDFDGFVLNKTSENLSYLLNLLLYIKKVSTTMHFNDDQILFLSNIAGNLTEIAMVNDGIFKILQIEY